MNAGGAAGPALASGFQRHVHGSGLLGRGQTVLLGFSGGLDSTVLLHLLRFAVPELELRLAAAHLDHAMRPGSSADARWARGVCRAWDVAFLRRRLAVAPRSEADARRVRYRFLAAAAARVGAGRIATAHHADDQAETVLFRAVRGTGPDGLAAIAPRRGRVVRPLLPFRRSELEAYAAAVGLAHRIDPSNRALHFTRNRIRHEVLPRLEAIVPGAVPSLARLAELSRRDREAWTWVLDRLQEEAVTEADGAGFVLARNRVLSYHPQVRARLLRHLFGLLGVVPDRGATLEADRFVSDARSGSGIDLGRIRLEREFDRILIRPGPPSVGSRRAVKGGSGGDGSRQQAALIPASGSGEARALLAGRPVRVRWELAAADGEPGAAEFDPDALAFPLRVRARRAGDRIRLSYGTKTVKKLLLERRVPVSARGAIAVLADATGAILWIPGHARSEAAKPRPGEPALHIRVLDADRSG